MPIDDALPDYDVRSHHERMVASAPETALEAALGVPVARDAIVGALFRLRGLPTGGTMETFFRAAGFAELERTPTRLVLGAAGRPWAPRSGLTPLERAGPGQVRMAFELAAEPAGEGRALLRTETRVAAADPAARRAFRRYWFVVGPFSSVIRQRWLAAAARVAEQ